MSVKSDLPAMRKICAVRRRGERFSLGLLSARCFSDRSPEESADVHFVSEQTSEANIAIMDQMHFEIGFERQSAGMDLEAEPGPIIIRDMEAAAIGSHDS